jgi:hypothetical protein
MKPLRKLFTNNKMEIAIFTYVGKVFTQGARRYFNLTEAQISQSRQSSTPSSHDSDFTYELTVERLTRDNHVQVTDNTK